MTIEVSGADLVSRLSALESKHEALRSDHDGHEDLCAERYGNIRDSLGKLEKGVINITFGAWAIVLSVLGFALLQLWHLAVFHTPT